MVQNMRRAMLLFLFVCIGDISAVQLNVETMGTPWWSPEDRTWFVTKASDRVTLLGYASELQQQKIGSLVYLDKLLLQNGSTIFAAVLSSDHVGVGAGFATAVIEPISMARLNRGVQENRQRNMVPVSACGHEESDGRILFEPMWMPSKTIEYQVQFDNNNQTMANFQNQGYYAISVCSTKTLNSSTATPSVVIIWNRQRTTTTTTTTTQPASAPLEQRIVIDVPDSDCSSANIRNARELFYPISMQLFNKGKEVRCSAIWQKMTAPSLKYEVRIGTAPVDVVNLNDKQMKPRQISVFRDVLGREQMMVLWTNYDTRNISFDGSIYGAADNIPINWLPGSTTGMKAEDRVRFESMVTRVMLLGQIPALTFAVSRNEQLKRAVAFGYANPLTKEAANVRTKFRLGSVSKVLTAAAIFSLIDQGLLSLNATVFGQGGILGTQYGTQPYSQNLLKVRLVHLLEHSSGGWGGQTTGDELFALEGYNQSEYIGIEIDKYGPVVEPGTVFDYANFGYYLLGVIITKVTGKPYDEYLKEKFWRPAGTNESQIGIEKRWFSERQANEAMFFPDAQSITDSYDLIDAERVASAGGWIASPSDVLRVARLFNGFNNTKDVLSSASLAEMNRPSTASAGLYCRGIAVGTDFIGVWHNGYYPGGSAMYQRFGNGIELMYMHNKGPDTSDVSALILGLGKMFIDLTPNWPQQDLFST